MSEVRKVPIEVLLVDDHRMTREGLRLLLQQEKDILVIGEASTGTQAIERAHDSTPHVVLLDIRLAYDERFEGNGLSLAAELKKELPNVKILILSAYSFEAYLRRGIEVGVDGYLLKDRVSGESLARVIREVAEGNTVLHPPIARALKSLSKRVEPELTGRELEILKLLAQGSRNKEIARVLKLNKRTAEAAVARITEKLGAETRTQAVVQAIKRGLIEV